MNTITFKFANTSGEVLGFCAEIEPNELGRIVQGDNDEIYIIDRHPNQNVTQLVVGRIIQVMNYFSRHKDNITIYLPQMSKDMFIQAEIENKFKRLSVSGTGQHLLTTLIHV